MPRALTGDQIQAFRSQLCKVATRLFAERGYAGVTLRAITQELGCSAMTPYRYFANKDEIFSAVRIEAFRSFGERTEAVARRVEDPIQRLRALGRSYAHFAAEEPHAYRIMFQLDQPEHLDDPLLDIQQHEAVSQAWTVVETAMAECIDAGLLEGDAEQLTRLCWLGLHGAVSLYLAGKLRLENVDGGLEGLIEQVSDVFLRGSAARPAKESP
jgi:AcrR family transcriptional regulator